MLLSFSSAETAPTITPRANASAQLVPTELQILKEAYVTNDIRVLTDYAHADDTNLRYYASALLDVSNRRFDALTHDGDNCFGVIPVMAQSAAALFQCLFVVTSGENIANHPRESYIWEARTVMFYNHFWRLIDKAMGGPNSYGVQDLQLPSLTVIRTWPEQMVAIDNSWRTVPLHDLHVRAVIGDLPIDMIVDTGSTGITLSDNVIKDLQRKNAIVSLDTIERMGGIANVTSSKAYYVPWLQFGPITITNAYVGSANGSHSFLGIHYLELLHKFTLSHNSIRRLHKSPSSFCSTMRFSHVQVVDIASYPYLHVPTSLGRLGLMLDSGLTGRGPFADTTVALKRSFGVKVVPGGVDAGKVASESLVIGTFVGGGKTIRFRTAVFGWNVIGVPTKGYVGLDLGAGRQVAGSMTSGFLKLFDVSYDYPGGIMCITPRKSGSSLPARYRSP